jgi:hypothetical protein
MKQFTLRAHFDGRQICLDEPLNIEPNTDLLITVTPVLGDDEERQMWLNLSVAHWGDSFGTDPEYPLSSIKTPNPDYEGG